MKTLKKGRDQKGWSKEEKCTGLGNGGGGCGALLLVEQGDIFRTTSHARDETTNHVTFACHDCGVLTDMKIYGGPVRVGDLPLKNPRRA